MIGERIIIKIGDLPEVAWVVDSLEPTEFAGQEWVRLSLASGGRRRDALVTDEIAGDESLRRGVLREMAQWASDIYDKPGVLAYVYARNVRYDDGSSGPDQLVLMIFDLEGVVQAIYPTVDE